MKKILKKTAAALLALTMFFTASAHIDFSFRADAATSAVWPVDKKYQNITTYFNVLRNEYDVSGYHNAIDIEADGGANIYAVHQGKCVCADWMDAYGYMVILWHEDLGVYTFYAHCSSMSVSVDQEVNAGDIIAAVGNTGNSFGNHLHYGICNSLMSGWPCRTYSDPLTYFTYDGTSVSDPTQNTWNGSEEYAGVYTTKGITTFLNIRSLNTVDSAIVGKILPDTKINVKSGDGKWAYIEYNGTVGYCSMDYIQRVNEGGETVQPETPADKFSTDYAGIYTTKGITDYLNIRKSDSTDSEVIGKIMPNDKVTVIKGDGKWAYIEHNGVSGYCSMDYIQKVSDIESEMSISGETVPAANVAVGSSFGVRGIISSKLEIEKVYGGIYAADGTTAVQVFEDSPKETKYNLSGSFDSHIIFNQLKEGSYVYKIEAEDKNGKKFTLINSAFTVSKNSIIPGDLNDDKSVTISDAVLLQSYLIKGYSFTALQYASADMNGDNCVDTFDLVFLKKKINEK